MASPLGVDRGATAAWALLLGCSVVYFFTINEADNDLWGHLLAGRDILVNRTIPRVDSYSYTVAGQPWVNHEWLAQVGLAAAYLWTGSPGLLLLKLVVATTTFLVLLKSICDRTATTTLRGAIGLLTIAVMARGFAIRPQIFTYCGVALLFAALDAYTAGRRRVLWSLPILFLVWANLHGGFAFGLAAFGWFVVADLLFGIRRSFLPLAVWITSAAATAINPWGPTLPRYIGNEMSRPHPIGEWQPASTGDAAQLVFFAMLALVILTLPFMCRWRERGWHAVLAAGVGVLAMRQQRHTPLFALCAAAPLAAQMDEAIRWLRGRLPLSLSLPARRVIGGAVVVLGLMQLALTLQRLHRDGLQITFDPAEYPVAAVQALRQAAAHGNLAVPLDWGAYVLWFLNPEIKVSLDGRFATVFPEQVVEDNFAFFNGAPGWHHLLERYPTEAALVPVGSPCPIAMLPDWKLVFQSAVARLYARDGTVVWPSFENFPRTVVEPTSTGVFP